MGVNKNYKKSKRRPLHSVRLYSGRSRSLCKAFSLKIFMRSMLEYLLLHYVNSRNVLKRLVIQINKNLHGNKLKRGDFEMSDLKRNNYVQEDFIHTRRGSYKQRKRKGVYLEIIEFLQRNINQFVQVIYMQPQLCV